MKDSGQYRLEGNSIYYEDFLVLTASNPAIASWFLALLNKPVIGEVFREQLRLQNTDAGKRLLNEFRVLLAGGNRDDFIATIAARLTILQEQT